MARSKIACVFSAVVFSMAAFCGLVVLSGCSCSSIDAQSSETSGSVFDAGNSASSVSSSSSATSGEDSEISAQDSASEIDNIPENGASDNPSGETDYPSDTEGEVLVTMDEITGPIVDRDVPTINGYFEDIFFDPTIYGVTNEEFIDTFFDGFSCEVADVDIRSDDTVEVSLYMKTRDGQQAVDLLTDAYQNMLNTGTEIDCKQVMENVDPFIFDDPYYFKAYLIKNNNGIWELEDKAAFGTALLGGYDPRQLMDEG